MRRHTLFAIVLLIGSSLPSAAEVLYSVTDLGTLGGSYTQGRSLNNAGQVTGDSYTADGARHAFFYANGQMQDLEAGTSGFVYSVGYGINNSGQITEERTTGVSTTSTGMTHAFIYSNGQITDLGTLGGKSSAGLAINDVGQVTGWADTAGATGSHAFLYTKGQMQDLGALGGIGSYGTSLNNAGQIAGFAYLPQGIYHAFLYSNGQMIDLNPPGSRNSEALAINNAGQVIGSAQVGPFGYTHLFIYSDGQTTDVPSNYLLGESINNAGQIVGNAGDHHAILYSGGQLYDLNKLIDPALHLTLDDATAINDNGQIVVNQHIGYTEGTYLYRSYLLTPIPEPSTWALLSVSMLGGGAWVRRRSRVKRMIAEPRA